MQNLMCLLTFTVNVCGAARPSCIPKRSEGAAVFSVAFHFQSPLVFTGRFKSGKLPFFLSGFRLYSPCFSQTKGTDRKFVSECCEEACKVHIADLLLKSPRRLPRTPTIKTLLPVWRLCASSWNHTSLLCLFFAGGIFFLRENPSPDL